MAQQVELLEAKCIDQVFQTPGIVSRCRSRGWKMVRTAVAGSIPTDQIPCSRQCLDQFRKRSGIAANTVQHDQRRCLVGACPAQIGNPVQLAARQLGHVKTNPALTGSTCPVNARAPSLSRKPITSVMSSGA